jgi:hypothetical protein
MQIPRANAISDIKEVFASLSPEFSESPDLVVDTAF